MATYTSTFTTLKVKVKVVEKYVPNHAECEDVADEGSRKV